MNRRLWASLAPAFCVLGCTWWTTPMPTISWQNGPAALNLPRGRFKIDVNFATPASKQYRTQFVAGEVNEFVIGLFDAYNEAGSGVGPYMGYEFTGGSTGIVAMPSLPSYIEILAGTAEALGRLRNGISEVSGSSGVTLSRSQVRSALRWLLVKRSIALSDSVRTRNTTFSNLKPGANRYYLFAAAFLQAAAATESHLAGFAQDGPFSLAAGETVGKALLVPLNFGLGSINATASVIDATPSATAI